MHGHVHNDCMVDLRRLQVLRAVAQHGTVTAAAAAVHLTPSGASQQLRALSAEVGAALVEPQGRRIRLTPAAHTLLAHADTLAAQWEQAQADIHAHTEEITGTLRLCGFPTAVTGMLAPTAAHLRSESPRLAVQVTEIEPAEAFALLLSGDADLTVIEATPEIPPQSDPKFDQQPLLDEPMDLLVYADHPLATRNAVTLAEVAQEPWIVGRPDSSYYQLVLVACAAAGFAPDIAHHAKEWIAVSALVGCGLGIALVPRLGHIPPEHAVARVALHGEPVPSRRILTCLRRGSGNQPAITRAIAILHNLARTYQ